MNTAKLWLTLLCICVSRIMSLTTDCDWMTEYGYDKRCCKACPKGEYPTEKCSVNHGASKCVKCSPNHDSAENKCFCNKSHLCSDDKCDHCEPPKKCRPGFMLTRTGLFDYTYTCEACPENTYNDLEDSACKPIKKCVGVPEIFPGNQTHNAICGSRDKAHPTETVHPASESVHTDDKARQNERQTAHFFMTTCLVVTMLTCMAFLMYIAFKMLKNRMHIRSRKSCKTPTPDTYSCKLSKEEMGEKYDYRTEVSENSVSLIDIDKFP